MLQKTSLSRLRLKNRWRRVQLASSPVRPPLSLSWRPLRLLVCTYRHSANKIPFPSRPQTVFEDEDLLEKSLASFTVNLRRIDLLNLTQVRIGMIIIVIKHKCQQLWRGGL